MADLPPCSSIVLSAGHSVGRTARMYQAAIDSARAEAYSAGWLNGAADILDELARARAITSTGGKRTAARIRQRLDLPAERPAWLSDTAPTPTEAPDA